jgi:general secretion pathway protein G
MKRQWAAKSGFTIVELVITMVVIAILAGIVIVSYGSIQSGARDAERESHITQLKIALQKYYADNSTYPDVCSGGSATPCSISELTDALGSYIDVIPHDPRWDEDSEDDYQYIRGDVENSAYGLRVVYEIDGECKTGKNLDEYWWGAEVPACGNEAFVTSTP